MGTYFCQGCNSYKDSKCDGFIEYANGAYCDSCIEKLFDNQAEAEHGNLQ